MKIKTCLAESSTVVLSKLELFIGPKKKYQRSGRVFFYPHVGRRSDIGDEACKIKYNSNNVQLFLKS